MAGPGRCYRSQVQIARGRTMKTLATALLVLLSMLVAESSIAQQGINAPPDTIFYNGKIITVDSGFTIQQAFAVRGEQYVAVGTNAAIRALAGEKTRSVDLRGSAVIPGLSDNHDTTAQKSCAVSTWSGPPQPRRCSGDFGTGSPRPSRVKPFSEASGGGRL